MLSQTETDAVRDNKKVLLKNSNYNYKERAAVTSKTKNKKRLLL